MRPFPLILLCAVACGGPALAPGPVEFAGPPGSGEPNLFGTSDGRVILTWLEAAGDEAHRLRVAERIEGVWSEPRTVVTRTNLFVNWADFPSLVETDDGAWIAHWLEKVAPAPYAYHVMTARSVDRGATWTAGVRVHEDTSATEHGFVTMVPLPSGRAAVTWLDGRAMASDGHAGGDGHASPRGAMTLRFRTVAPDGSFEHEALLDDRTCECCQTALAPTRSGLVVAYRDRSPDEIRDVVVRRYRDGTWSEPIAPGHQGWQIAGCPVNGPALAATGDTVVVAWFTAAREQPRVYAAFSVDGGERFGEPITVDDGHPMGRVDVEFLEPGQALVVWLERGADATEIRGRVVRSDGGAAGSWLVARSSEARASGFPRLARAGQELVFAWTETGPNGGVRAAAARLP